MLHWELHWSTMLALSTYQGRLTRAKWHQEDDLSWTKLL
jgi:hypothetical protein